MPNGVGSLYGTALPRVFDDAASQGTGKAAGLGQDRRVGEEEFAEALVRAETAIVSPHSRAAKAVDSFTHGAQGSIHETMLAVEKADISFRFMVTVRNKIIDAYREVMRMGV